MKKFVLTISVLVLVGVASYYGYRLYGSRRSSRPETTQGANAKKQAVFLTNGQMYFGHVSNADQQIVVLRDVYYFKPEDLAKLRDENQSNLSGSGSSAAKNLSLVKLGSEIHGPEGVMYINRDQILYYEDIRGDSKISEAIDQQSSK
ncbi:MAG: hypothetical protein WCT32_04660 [Patescibacteria group bacterium]